MFNMKNRVKIIIATLVCLTMVSGTLTIPVEARADTCPTFTITSETTSLTGSFTILSLGAVSTVNSAKFTFSGIPFIYFYYSEKSRTDRKPPASSMSDPCTIGIDDTIFADMFFPSRTAVGDTVYFKYDQSENKITFQKEPFPTDSDTSSQNNSDSKKTFAPFDPHAFTG